MRTQYWFYSIIAVLCLPGCEAVFTEQPMGEEVVKLDRTVWQATWLGDEVVLITTVMDADKGLLQAAWVERRPDGASFEAVTGTVRRTGDLLYLNMEHQPEEEGNAATTPPAEATQDAPEYYWARIENDGRRAVLWWPDIEQVKVAVGDGRLPGTIKEDKDVVLRPLAASHLQLINSPTSGLLKWSQPVTFLRIGD
jgi:hypothetical protein